MKKLVLLIVCIISSIASVKAQVEYYINQIPENGLTFCDNDSLEISIKKDPSFNGSTFWITKSNNVYQTNTIVLGKSESGRLLYLEKENEHLTGRDILWLSQEDMPEIQWQNLWLPEDGFDTLRAPEGYEYYFWASSNWPEDSTFIGTNELIVDRPGFYHCNYFDRCLHMSTIYNFTNQTPYLSYVTTNLTTNKRTLMWNSYEGSAYDTICVFKNDSIVGFVSFYDEIWEDPESIEGKYDSAQYSLSPSWMQNEKSKVQTGLKLNFESLNPEVHEVYFTIENPTKEGSEIEIQYYKLHRIENGTLTTIIPSIPTSVNGIEINDYENGDQIVLSAILVNNNEIYSNIVTIDEGVTGIPEKSIDIEVYPNPTQGLLNISAFISAEYKVFNIQGQLLKAGAIHGTQIDLSELSKGLYTIEIIGGPTTSYKEKFVIK